MMKLPASTSIVCVIIWVSQFPIYVLLGSISWHFATLSTHLFVVLWDAGRREASGEWAIPAIILSFRVPENRNCDINILSWSVELQGSGTFALKRWFQDVTERRNHGDHIRYEDKLFVAHT